MPRPIDADVPRRARVVRALALVCLLVATSVGADDLAGPGADVVPAGFGDRAVLGIHAFCPPVMRPGAAFQVPISFRNRVPQPVTVTRGALSMYLGRSTLTGPKAFSVSASMQGSSGVGEPATADTTLDVLLPSSARTGTFVSLALSFFGRVGESPRRQLLGAAACHIEVAAPDRVVLTSIEVTPASASVPPGASQRFMARGRFSDGTTEEPLSGVTWTSGATGVATVDPSGSATAIAPGTARIRASRDGVVSPPAILTVPSRFVVSVVVSPPTSTLDVGAGAQFTATEVLSDGTRRDATGVVQWRSDGPSVATADATGFVRAIDAGVTSITAHHPAGLTASASVTVTRRLQIRVTVAPAPLAIPPDGAPKTFTVRLSADDTIPHTVNLSVSDTTVATVSPASVTFAAGQTTALASVTGLKGGLATLTLQSPTLAVASVPVLVTTEFRGVNTALAPLLGVLLQAPAGPSPTVTIGPVRSAAVGVILGSAIQSVSPNTLIIGTGPTPVVISGAGLEGVTAVSLVPPDGLTLGALTVAPDGRSVTAPMTVAADAVLGLRQIVVTAGGQRILPATADADRILVSLPSPVVDSIEPLFAIPGTAGLTLTVRGRNLQAAQSVILSPSQDITVASVPVVNGDGTQLTVGVTVGATASPGSRVVTVRTPGGISSATPSPANTLTIVSQIRETFTPVVAPTLGVVKEAAPAPSSQTFTLFSSALGVARGSVATAVSPSAGSIGTSVTLRVDGSELQGVTAIQLLPVDGLVVSAPVVAGDGRSATVDVTIASDAPQSVRTVRVLAGATPIAFANPAAGLFRVTAPPPRLDSVSPIVIQTGTVALPLTLRGVNFQNAERVTITPPGNISVGLPAVSADGTSLTVAVTVAVAATPGQRVLAVATPAGTTSTDPSPANTITVTNTIGSTFTPVVAPVLGVLKQETVSTPPISIGPLVSPSLGVTFLTTPPPAPSFSALVTAPNLGVAVGSVATSVDPPAVAPATTGTLTVRGFGLTVVTAVTLNPPDGVTLGGAVVNGDGTEVSVPFTVAAGQATSVREVILTTATGRVTFAQPQSALLRIQDIPVIDSIAPIVVCTGTASVQLTVRGRNLQGALAVTATPPDGITAGAGVTVTVESGADAVRVDLAIAASAPTGGRVIRVIVPGFASKEQAEPANTLTVIDRPNPDTGGVCPGIQ